MGTGKLIGAVPADAAILDRFLHNAEVIAVIGRSDQLKDCGEKRPCQQKATAVRLRNQEEMSIVLATGWF